MPAAPQLLQQSGKYLNIAQAQRLFIGSTLIAGVALPVNAATLASTFTLWNPPNSGLYVEPVEFGVGLTTATTVVTGIACALQFNVTTNPSPPTSPTIAAGAAATAGAATGGVSTDGQRSSVAKLYSALTLTNVAILGPTFCLMGGFGAITDAGMGPVPYTFDGKFYLPPDSLITFVATKAAEAVLTCSLSWIEW